MRDLLLTCLLASCFLKCPAQTAPPAAQTAPPATTQLAAPATTLATARAGQAQGKLVFCYTQPTAPYDVAFTYQASVMPSERMTLNTIIDAGVQAAVYESGLQQRPFDAIIIQAGSRDQAIKFRDNVPQADRALATVSKNQGKLVFLFCEPVTDYTVVKTEGISWYNHAFGGAFYTFAKVQENLLKTAKKDDRIEAILFGETASYISFKK